MKCHFNTYQQEIGKLTASNSALINDRVIYICRKNYAGKPVKCFVAYDYKTKIQLYASLEKEELIEFLEKQDFKVLDDLQN